jgi:glutathione S-transferase
MKLYSGDLSPYSARVRMQIYAKGIGDIPLELAPGDVIPESDVIAEYIEEIHPTPSLLGANPRETATVRVLARLADIYLQNNMFMLAGQTRRSTRSEAVRDLLSGQVVRGVGALERMIEGEGGFACLGRLTLADCSLVPALFMIENVLPATEVADPIPGNPKVAAYWAAIQTEPSAVRVIDEMMRGLEERRALLRAAGARARAAEAAGG